MHSSHKTSWRIRLLGISLAGGALVACSSATSSDADAGDDASVLGADSGSFACNANPDPCCKRDHENPQDPVACAAKDAAADAKPDAPDSGADADGAPDADAAD
jgi:hypothetical protein